jgi:predicted TIM-barrel fold metal-dependent hydrolase
MHWLSSGTSRTPVELKDRLSEKSSDLVKWAMEDIDPAKLVDYHVHVAGIGAGGTNLFVNPRMLTWQHPFHRVKFAFYRHACGVSKEEETDSQMVNRLADLIRNLPAHGTHRLLAFDKHYNPDGTVNLAKTEFYVPNEYVFNLTAKHPDLFLPTMSVHPYRSDAITELETWASRGGRMVKWLPNAMGMNPADPKCDRFYAKMKELGLTLLSHGGEEKAVEADEDQKLGNPLLLRRALDHGVKVIVAHCAGLGTNEDLDHPGRERRSNFDLFMRLMDDPKYDGLVFGEISAMSQFNRLGAPLTTILSREDLHPRLINGSDYPLPAINLLIRTSPLVKGGYITAEQRLCLKEIYGFNPLLFDLVLKRCLVAPGTNRRLPPSVFYEHPHLKI